MSHGYAEAVHGWTAHLLAGGTSTWADWLAGSRPVQQPAADHRAHALLADATHLELVRRLNELGADPALASLVLETPAPGRGRVDVPLPWSGDDAPRFGTPATAPEDLPVEELLRLATGVLAALLEATTAGTADAGATPVSRWPLPGRRRFRVHGSPRTADELTRALAAASLVQSDWRPVHLVVALPLDVMMREEWATEVAAGSSLKWSTFWRRAAAGHLPHRVDVAGTADRLARDGAEVHVLCGTGPAEDLELGARLLHLQLEAAPVQIDPVRIELRRRVNRVLALAVPPDRSVALGRLLEDRVLPPSGEHDGHDRRLGVPRAARSWARRRADELADQLSVQHAGQPATGGSGRGYAVHGDPAVLTALEERGPAGVDQDRTLGLALQACLRGRALQGGR